MSACVNGAVRKAGRRAAANQPRGAFSVAAASRVSHKALLCLESRRGGNRALLAGSGHLGAKAAPEARCESEARSGHVLKVAPGRPRCKRGTFGWSGEGRGGRKGRLGCPPARAPLVVAVAQPRPLRFGAKARAVPWPFGEGLDREVLWGKLVLPLGSYFRLDGFSADPSAFSSDLLVNVGGRFGFPEAWAQNPLGAPRAEVSPPLP